MRNRSQSLSALMVVLWLSASTSGILFAEPADSSLPEKLDSILSEIYPRDEPGAAVIVVKDGTVLLRKGYGLAQVELGVAIEPEMVFRLGSITKQFTGAAIMLLEEEGKLSVKDSISKYLPDYPVHGHEITIEHLLTHTSGIYNYTAIPGYMAEKVRNHLTTEELVEAFKDQPMNFSPGERWSYSNSGYVLLGAIIEKVSGKSYADFVQERIFDPLGMKNSHYGGHQIIAGRVAGYGWNGTEYTNSSYLSMTQPHAAGSLLSNVDDLYRWNQALERNELLGQDSYDRMTTGFKLNDGEDSNYGYGFATGKLRGRPVISHGGGIFGFATYAFRIPEANSFIAILTNRPGKQPNPTFVGTKIGAYLVDDPFPSWTAADVDPQILAGYVGVYKIDDDDERTVTLEDGVLYTQRTGGGKTKVIPASETTFFYETSFSYFEIVRDASGKASHMLMYQNGEKESEKAVRVAGSVPSGRHQIELDPSVYDSYTGVFELAPGFELTVTREGDRLITQATGQSQVEVFPESRNRFFLKVVDAQLTFVWDPDGAVNKVILHQGGREVSGKRVK